MDNANLARKANMQIQQNTSLTPTERLSLLTKPVWTTAEIAKYLGLSQTAAYNLRRKLIKDDKFKVDFSKHKIKADPLLAEFGTSRANEIELLTKAACESVRKA